eukprot:XP_011674497.1 PREDICTED: uncharacterized protein LOC100889163 [Strongylocentrotus purpuratus]
MPPRRHHTTIIKGFLHVLLVLCLGSYSQTTNVEQGPEDTNHHDDRAGGGGHLNLKEGTVMGNYEAGQTQVMSIQRDSKHPRYGSCWINALEAVSTGCKRLTDDEQSRMALTLANCHLAKAGFDTYPCDDTMDIRDCLNPMKGDSISFNAYTEFFTHTQDICFFLQSQVWHQQTEDTVEKLAQSSEDVAVQLEVTGRLQEDMIKQQNESLKNQQEILAQEAKLNQALKSSTNSIHEVFAEMKSSTLEQKALFAETFDRVAQVQRLMLGEFTWFNSVIYFVVVVLLVYMVTATPRTASARFSLFLLLLVNWFIESVMFRIIDSSDQTVFHANTWWCRKIFCCLGLLLLIYRASQYKDYNQINHRILLQIQTHIQQQKISASNNPYMLTQGLIQSSSAASLSIASPLKVPAIQDRVGQTIKSKSTSRHDITGFSSDSDVDTTFNPENLASSESQYSSSSDQSFMTAEPASRKQSIADQQASKTPFRTNSHGLQTDDPGSSAKRKRGRPKGSKNRTSREGTPVPNLSFQSPYNLRQRVLTQSPNPLLDLETTIMFAQQVESMASRHYVIQRKRTPSSGESRSRRSNSPAKSRKGPAFFSSDEEP